MADLNLGTQPPFNYRMAQRGAATESAVLAANETLAAREISVAIDTGAVWIGDGLTPISGLPKYRLSTTTGGGGGSGTPGVGVSTATINGSGHLVITLTNGATVDAGVAKGADGLKGDKGDTGAASTVAGPPGNNGTNGATPVVTVGTTTTGAAGSAAAVVRRDGSPDTAPVLDFTIPAGIQGVPGAGSQVVVRTGYSPSDVSNPGLGDLFVTDRTSPSPGDIWQYQGATQWNFVATVNYTNTQPGHRSAYRLGGTHATSNMGGTQAAIRQRTPGMRLPVHPDLWRIHFRNYLGLSSQNTGANPLTVQNMFMAPQAGPSAASEYVCSQALQAVPGATSGVQGKTEWVSLWHKPSAVGITDARKPFNLQMDLSWVAGDYIGNTSSMWCAMLDTVASGTGVTSRTVADPGAIGTAGSAAAWYTYNYMVGEVWIEYQWTDSSIPEVPNVLMVGHSYADGAQFSSTPGMTGTPSGFAQKFARRHRAAVAVNAYSTSKMTDWVNGATVSDKFDILTVADGYSFDAVVIVLGGNDIVNDASAPTAATLLTRYQAVVNAVASKYPGVPIYGTTNTPFGAAGDTTQGSGNKTVTAAMVTAQAGFNAGLWTTIRGLAGVFDFEAVMRDPANLSRPQALLLGADAIHPTPKGYDKLADAITLF